MDDPEDAVVDKEKAGQDHTAAHAVGGPYRRERAATPRDQHLGHVQKADDAVLDPVGVQDGADAPAEPEHADQRHEIGRDEQDDGEWRGAAAYRPHEPAARRHVLVTGCGDISRGGSGEPA